MASIFCASFLLLLAVSFSSSSFITCFAEVSRKELRSKENDLGMVTQLSRTSHSNRVNPSRVVQLSWRPRVFLYKGFLSDQECDQLIFMTHKLNEKSSNNSGDTVSEWRLESLKTRELSEDDIVSRIDKRISAWTFLPQENGKALKVMRYGVEDSNKTLDYLGNRPSEEEYSESYPIIATVVLYLSNVSRGGQILFPDSEVKDDTWSECGNGGHGILRPTRGNAILFFSRNHDTTVDYRSDHARCPVLGPEEMWCATKLFRVKVDITRQKAPSDDFLCYDQNRSCPKWAHLGECEKNPVFMVGSDDYFGTCRFSCKVC